MIITVCYDIPKKSFHEISEQRVRSLARVSPLYHQQCRRRTERQTNPHLYVAEYYGHKLHLDQNEKLVGHVYSVTHICCNIVIYDIFRC